MSPVKTDAYSLDELRLFAKNPVKLRAQVPFREESNPVLAIREFYAFSEVPIRAWHHPPLMRTRGETIR